MTRKQELLGQSKKDLARYIINLENHIQKTNKFIQDECTTLGEVNRMYATMRVAIADALGDEATTKVIEHIRELTDAEAQIYKPESKMLFGEDLERPKMDEVAQKLRG